MFNTSAKTCSEFIAGSVSQQVICNHLIYFINIYFISFRARTDPCYKWEYLHTAYCQFRAVFFMWQTLLSFSPHLWLLSVGQVMFCSCSLNRNMFSDMNEE